MRTTIGAIRNLSADAAAVEIYVANSAWNGRIHTDGIDPLDVELGSLADDVTVLDFDLLDESGYNLSVNANTSLTDSFSDLYGDADAKVLVIVIASDVYKQFDLIAFASMEGADLIPSAGLSDYVNTARVYIAETEMEAAHQMMHDVAEAARAHGYTAEISEGNPPCAWHGGLLYSSMLFLRCPMKSSTFMCNASESETRAVSEGICLPVS